MIRVLRMNDLDLAGKRVVVTTFASNVARLQTLGEVARETGRQLCVAGRSLDRIIEVARTGISILMVEQNARQALEIADKGYVLVQGANRFTDTGKALMADPEVRRSFLGG